MRVVVWPLIAFGLLLSDAAWAEEPAALQRGKQMYLRYCSACHGKNARGEGTLREVLRTPPTDLTRIRTRDRKFDASRVARFIDGRETVRAHGSATMPVWGVHFSRDDKPRSDAIEGPAQEKINLLMVYLRSIQVPGR